METTSIICTYCGLTCPWATQWFFWPEDSGHQECLLQQERDFLATIADPHHKWYAYHYDAKWHPAEGPLRYEPTTLEEVYESEGGPPYPLFGVWQEAFTNPNTGEEVEGQYRLNPIDHPYPGEYEVDWAQAAKELVHSALSEVWHQWKQAIQPYSPWSEPDESAAGIDYALADAAVDWAMIEQKLAAQREGALYEVFSQFNAGPSRGAAPYGWHRLSRRQREILNPEDPDQRPFGVVKDFPNPMAE